VKVNKRPGSDRSSSASSSSHSSPAKTPSGDERFLDAAAQHKAAAQRHLKEQEHFESSEEENLNDEEIMEAMLKSFNTGAGELGVLSSLLIISNLWLFVCSKWRYSGLGTDSRISIDLCAV
jgi:hypothetical protein